MKFNLFLSACGAASYYFREQISHSTWITAGCFFLVGANVLVNEFFLGGSRKYYGKTHDCTGDVVLITGGNKGIGFETAKELAKFGAQIIIACRSERRASTAVRSIRSYSKNDNVSYEILDLESLKSVHDLVDRLTKKKIQIRYLINNAGVAIEKSTTIDGFNSQFQINHLSHFLLTNLLLKRNMITDNGRIISLSSLAHGVGGADIHLDDLNSTRSWKRLKMYGNTKLMNIVFTNELSRKLLRIGSKITANSVHPGAIDTDFSEHVVPNPWIRWLMRPIAILLTDPPVLGAQSTLFAALSPDLETKSGVYIDNCKVKRPVGKAQNIPKHYKLMEDFWEVSAKFVGQSNVI